MTTARQTWEQIVLALSAPGLLSAIQSGGTRRIGEYELTVDNKSLFFGIGRENDAWAEVAFGRNQWQADQIEFVSFGDWDDNEVWHLYPEKVVLLLEKTWPRIELQWDVSGNLQYVRFGISGDSFVSYTMGSPRNSRGNVPSHYPDSLVGRERLGDWVVPWQLDIERMKLALDRSQLLAVLAQVSH